jgi:hypothetical protein
VSSKVCGLQRLIWEDTLRTCIMPSFLRTQLIFANCLLISGLTVVLIPFMQSIFCENMGSKCLHCKWQLIGIFAYCLHCSISRYLQFCKSHSIFFYAEYIQHIYAVNITQIPENYIQNNNLV